MPGSVMCEKTLYPTSVSTTPATDSATSPTNSPEMTRALVTREPREADGTRASEKRVDWVVLVVEALLDRHVLDRKRLRCSQSAAKWERLAHVAIVSRTAAAVPEGRSACTDLLCSVRKEQALLPRALSGAYPQMAPCGGT